MGLSDKYTTAAKIAANKNGIEEKKELLSSDAYAIGEMIDVLISKIEHVRLNLTK
jgi:hypothetical protein